MTDVVKYIIKFLLLNHQFQFPLSFNTHVRGARRKVFDIEDVKVYLWTEILYAKGTPWGTPWSFNSGNKQIEILGLSKMEEKNLSQLLPMIYTDIFFYDIEGVEISI